MEMENKKKSKGLIEAQNRSLEEYNYLFKIVCYFFNYAC